MKRIVRFPICVAQFVVLIVYFAICSEGACPSHCQSLGSACDAEPDDGCPACEQEYYGRQCDLRMECRFSDLGTEYRGVKNTTINGITCQRWDSQSPHGHNRNGEENFCRNPDRTANIGPWCYTTDPLIRFQGCGIPFCSQQCKQPTLPPGASVVNPATPGEGFFVGFTLNIRCPDGVPRQSNCSQSGSIIDWSLFTCPDIYCERPINVNSHAQPDKPRYVYGERINVLCDTGYETMNRTQFRCQKDTSWDGIFPTCTAVKCPAPTLNPNTQIVSPKASYFYQDEITIECNTGFEPLNQSGNKSKHICQANKVWNGNFLTCQVVKCPVPSLNNVTRISQDTWKTDYVYKDQISLTCETGYEIADNITKYNCTEQKTFYPPVKNCTAVMCSIAEIPQNLILKPNQPTYSFRNVINLQCRTGFSTNSSNEYFACLANKKWNGTFPLCIRKACEVPILPKNTHISNGNDNGIFVFEDSPLVQCDEGFEIVGEARITCLADQTWSKIPPCTEVTNSTVGIVLGVLVACVAVAFAGFLFIFWRRKQKQREDSKSLYRDPVVKQINTPNLEIQQKTNAEIRSNIYVNVSELRHNSSVELIEETDDEGGDATPSNMYNDDDYDDKEYLNFASKRINISSFSEYIQRRKDEEFFADFALLKADLQRPTNTARMQQNRNKNKYKNIYPYDDNRVILKDFTNNDCTYINASPILGSHGAMKFIAAQGPIATTLIDFWRMIWQQNIKKIVMLTTPMEAGKLKCVEYWPNSNKTMVVGDLSLELQNEDEYADFIVRRINIKMDDKCHTVTQFYYRVWPDKSVPTCSGSLAIFHRKTTENINNKEPPILVHCSAGVGRTGTFIALDLLLEQAQEEGEVEPFSCIEELRRQRVNMVQTAEQYLFLHSELAKAWKIHVSTTPVHGFQEHYKWLKKVDKTKGKTNLALEFEAIDDPLFKTDPYEAGNREENIPKNRFQDILPVEMYRPYLQSVTSEAGNYINAVFIPSFKQKDHFIVTQSPLKNTVQDFLKLVEQEEVVTIVNLTQNPDLSYGNYYDSIGKFDVQSGEEKETIKGVYCRDLQISNQITKKTLMVREFSVNCWPDKSSVPNTPSGIMDLLAEVNSWQRKNGDPPIVVHCMNGASKCGLYCVLAYLMERLQSEQDVMLPIIVEHLRMRRPQILRSQAQYDFCYQCVENYCGMFETYANFN